MQEAIEIKAVTGVNQNTAQIQDLQDQLENALSKIDNFENRSRRYNFRIRGVYESFKDADHIVSAFIKELIPNIPDHRLGMDRAHRALQPPKRDLIVKPHFYKVKEEVMQRSRAEGPLTFQGHPIQIFADPKIDHIQMVLPLSPNILLQQ